MIFEGHTWITRYIYRGGLRNSETTLVIVTDRVEYRVLTGYTRIMTEKVTQVEESPLLPLG